MKILKSTPLHHKIIEKHIIKHRLYKSYSYNSTRMKSETNTEYEQLKERLCYKANIVHIGKAIQSKDKLFKLKEYLPNLLRMHINEDYYTTMLEYGVIEEVLDKMTKTKNNNREQNINEFKEWIEKHETFENLFNKKEYNNLIEQIKILDELYQ